MSVLLMDEYRRPPLVRKAVCPDYPRYFCLTCDTDHFKLYGNGSVNCANCGSVIRNVEVFSR